MAFPGDYTLLRKIPIDATAVTGSNNAFVGLITEAAFKLSKAFIFANTDNGGGDVRFSTDAVGANQIPVEIISWDTSGETCRLWYLADGVDSVSPTDLYIWGDNTGDSQPAVGAAFGRNAVYSNLNTAAHMEESSGSSAVDSAGNNNGTYGGFLPVQGADFGQFYEFNNAFTDFGDLGDFSGGVTLQVKIKSTDTTESQQFFSSDNTTGTDRRVQWRVNGNLGASNIRLVIFAIGGGVALNVTGSVNLVNNTEYLMTLTYDPTDGYKTYINGVLDINDSFNTAPNTASTYSFFAGAFRATADTDYLRGQIGEAFVKLNGAKSGDTIATESSNQLNVTDFYLEPVSPSSGVTVTADSGTYLYTGSSVDLIRAKILTADSGSYNYTGTSVSLLKGFVLTADAGSYSYLGQDVTLTYTPAGAFVLTADSGNYTYAGADINFNRDRVIIMASGTYNYNGTDIQTILPGQIWTDKPSVSTNWNNQTNVTTIWTDK